MQVLKNKRRITAVCLLLIIFISAPAPGRAIELGLTPSHVYGLWLNINTAFIEIQRATGSDPNVVGEIESMRPRRFQGKRPTDVYARATSLQKKLADIFDLGKPAPTPRWIADYQVLEGEVSHEEVTPSQVFLLSSQLLNVLVKKYVELTDGGRPISRFYGENKVTEKVPSDVYGLVDLLGRRLERARSRKEGTATNSKVRR